MPAKIFINRYLVKNYLKYYIIQKICHFAFICSMIFAPNERDPTENKLLFNEEEKVGQALVQAGLNSVQPQNSRLD